MPSPGAAHVQVWDKDSGEAYTAIEPPGGAINGVCVWPGSGLLMLATDAPKIPAYFVPSLGPAPPWCSFLEAVVEELEAAGGADGDAAAVYDDYRCEPPPQPPVRLCQNKTPWCREQFRVAGVGARLPCSAAKWPLPSHIFCFLA